MARSQKDDPCFGDMQHHTWNYRGDAVENCAAGSLSDRPQQSLLSTPNVIKDNMFGGSSSFASNDVYANKHGYNMSVPTSESANKDENIAQNNVQGMPRQNNIPNYAMLNLGNGQMVRVFYDENNQRLMIPVTGQYELFNHNQGLRDMPLPTQTHSPLNMFTLNQEYSVNDNNVHMAQPTTASQSHTFDHVNMQTSNEPTSNFLKEVLGNWEPNSYGTYSPFGQNYPLNHPDAPAMNISQSSPPVLETPLASAIAKPETSSPKRSDPLADTGNKKRIVAEVKPMRPSYSDVLAKNTKNNAQPEVPRKTKVTNVESKVTNKSNNNKVEKPAANLKHSNDDHKSKHENKKLNMTSSGSESGDITTDDYERHQKTNKKYKNKRNNSSRKWSSMDDLTKEEESSYSNANKDSQFVYIENNAEKPAKKEKKHHENKAKNVKSTILEDEFKIEEDDDDDESQFVFQENQGETKIRKKKERTIGYKSPKNTVEKKKTVQSKWRKNKPGYLGMAQGYLEHWGGATWKAVVWFLYLLSDICRMSAHLSFDLCTSVFTQTYVSSQAVWRSTKDWFRKLGGNKYLMYIDRKFGDTRFAFWRKLKWFRKEVDNEGGNESKLNSNIPLPATGDEAMKRLLACKGKDPYSILGVSTSCSDEQIKRHYRRQAFLVHPDKNQQPGAEEAFKILQHAFDIIGEPERRESFDRRAQESRHVEAAWGELSQLLAQLHDKMELAANTIRCTNCGRPHKRVATGRPCYAARYCAQCKIRHSAKEGDIWAESSMLGLLVMYYACMDGAVYQITQWASCQKKNLKQLRPDCHVVQYRIVLGNKAADAQRAGPDPNLEEFLHNLYGKSTPTATTNTKQPTVDNCDAKKKRNKKNKP